MDSKTLNNADSTLDKQVEESQKRINNLYERAGSPPTHQRGLLPETFEEMQILFNELSTACEELRQQNEALESAQHQLLIEHQRYYDLFNFIPDAYFLTDASGIIAEANRAALLLLEISPQFIKGKPLTTFIAEDHRDSFRKVILQLPNETGPLHWLFKLKPRHNKPFTVQISGACVRNALGDITGIRWLIRETDEHALAEPHGTAAELEQ